MREQIASMKNVSIINRLLLLAAFGPGRFAVDRAAG